MNKTNILGGLGVVLLLVLATSEGSGQPDVKKKDGKELIRELSDKIQSRKKDQILDALITVEGMADELHGSRMELALWAGGLLNRDPVVRKQAAKTIGALGARSQSGDNHVKRLIGALNDPDPEVLASLYLALGQMGPYAKPHFAKFVEGLKHEDARVRRASCVIFYHLRESPEKLVPVAIAALDDPDVVPDAPGPICVSKLAMIYLYSCKAPAKDAAPKLIKIANSKNSSESHQFYALRTLAVLAPEERLPLNTARKWLKKTDSLEVLRKGTGLLAELGPHAKDAVPELIGLAKKKLFDDPKVDLSFKGTIAATFERIGPAAKEALPTLEAMATTNDSTLRQRVLAAIKAVQGK